MEVRGKGSSGDVLKSEETSRSDHGKDSVPRNHTDVLALRTHGGPAAVANGVIHTVWTLAPVNPFEPVLFTRVWGVQPCSLGGII